MVETFGGLSPALYGVLCAAAEWRSNKLSASEYDETTWAARSWMTFVAQRLSVAVQLSMAQEAAEALGLSVAADPRRRELIARGNVHLARASCAESGSVGVLAAPTGVGVPVVSLTCDFIGCVLCITLAGIRCFPWVNTIKKPVERWLEPPA